MDFIKHPPASLSPIEKFIWFAKAEKEAKQFKDKLKKEANKECSGMGGYSKTNYGNAQFIEKNNKKPLDTLKFYLEEKGYLDMCKKDDIDLSKVEELIEAGLLDEEVVQHIQVTTTSYLKVK